VILNFALSLLIMNKQSTSVERQKEFVIAVVGA
jgi:hypothetical protein